MVQSFEDIIGGTDTLEEPVARPVKSFAELQEESDTEQLFAGGIDRVTQEQKIQEFTADPNYKDDDKFKLANSLYFAKTYNVPYEQAYQNHDGIVGRGEISNSVRAMVR